MKGSNKSKRYFVPMDVWFYPEQGGLGCHRCFHILPDDSYAVQSTDYFSLPFDPKELHEFTDQYLELLESTPPDIRSGTSPTLQEAIAKHEALFEDDATDPW